MLRIDSPVLLDPGARRVTRCAHCVRSAQTDAASQTYEARCARRPRLCAARRRLFTLRGTACRTEPTSVPCMERTRFAGTLQSATRGAGCDSMRGGGHRIGTRAVPSTAVERLTGCAHSIEALRAAALHK